MSSEQPESLRVPGQVKFHHVGFVLASIENEGEAFAQSLGATWDGKIIFDPLQKVRVAFLHGAHPHDALIELVEPAGIESPVANFLEGGGGLHHICYEVEDLDGHLAFCRRVQTLVIRQPVPAVAFNGRRIAWALTRKRLLVEFLEK